MKWEKYKLMTAEQKEEYNFRFRTKPTLLSLNGLISNVTYMIFSITIFLFLAYLFIADPNMIVYKSKVQNIFTLVAQLVTATFFIVLGYSIGAFILLIMRYYREKRWKKRNNIK